MLKHCFYVLLFNLKFSHVNCYETKLTSVESIHYNSLSSEGMSVEKRITEKGHFHGSNVSSGPKG
jgi:hypothetical protein